ncbi:MAG: Long-chain-fatty-acid--CoA ligase FadD13 [Pseudomonadales bacterium]|nr:Long-chain-fatty-acid--CoA ligase FadD13 [Pseudomonadales bacterium]
MSTIKAEYDQAVARITAPGAPFELEQATIDGVSYRVYRNAPRNLARIHAEALAHGEREFLVYEGERWSFAALLGQGARIAHALGDGLGIRPGDRVAIAMRNYPEWMSAFVGITTLGAVAVPLNSWGQARELAFALEDSGARAVFCDRQRAGLLAAHLAQSALPAIVARPGDGTLPAGTQSLDSFIAAHTDTTLPCADVDPEAPALMMYTSGTTGAPKGALSTQRAVCQSILNFECQAMASAMINPEAIGAMMRKGYPPTQMLTVPLFHVSGCHAVFLCALRAGRRIVMMYKWDVAKALELIERERVTAISAAPAMLQELLESPLFAQTDVSSLGGIGGGGAATPPRTARLLMERIPDAYPGAGWGLTETNSNGSACTGRPFREKPGSAGFLHPTVELSVRDDEGNECAPGTPGRLWVKTPTLVSGYWNRPDATAREFRDGWFDSGDIGYLDADGYLFLSDRAKDMVIRGGENIYPAEIEAALLEFDGVDEVAAFGVPDEALGEQLAVVVHRTPGARFDAEDLRRFASGQLAHFKVPHYVQVRDEHLPRNASGKILKKDIRAGFIATL